MDQAQGAIDAAQAAGADAYATTEYSAATEALENANAAAALNYALESREHARNAARGAADAKARVRVEVDHAATEITEIVMQGRAQLAAAEQARVPRPRIEQAAAELTAVATHLQEAGEAVAAGDYLRASTVLEGLRERAERALAAIDEMVPAGSQGR